MQRQGLDCDNLFTSEELAVHVVDTLVDHGLIDKARFKEAVALAQWEIEAKLGMGRVMLRSEKIHG